MWGLPEETDCARLVMGANQQLLTPPDKSSQESNKPSIPNLGDRQNFTSLLERGGFDHIDIRQVESPILVVLFWMVLARLRAIDCYL